MKQQRSPQFLEKKKLNLKELYYPPGIPLRSFRTKEEAQHGSSTLFFFSCGNRDEFASVMNAFALQRFVYFSQELSRLPAGGMKKNEEGKGRIRFELEPY
ncbi:5805_t:CDS:2 [Acaulospora colombiana]|uniref:5805_t:CDS:1 n=1 Tax=Acaulospora colombiana TaxID=27376 RepID=A0ACA9PT59_9GLOM|nr:5805_t:CDS:2 [Acaulospora colombiana]